MADAQPRDFVAIAKGYAQKALDPKNRKRFGIWMRFAAQRFLNDLERAKAEDAPFRFDEWHAIDVCDFAEKLPHVEGTWDTPTIVLHESHVFFLVQLFGFRKLDGTRRFTTALFAIARKNAKSTLASIISLYCLTCEGEVGPQVITAATTYDQASIVFVNGRMVSSDSQMTIDLDNKVIEMNWSGRRVRIDTNGFVFGPTGGTPKLFYNATTDQLTLNGTFTADAINAVSTVNVAGGTVTSMRVGQRDLGDYLVGTPVVYVDITMPAGSTGVVLIGSAEVRIYAASSSNPLVVSVVREADGAVLGTGRFASPNDTLDSLLVCVPVIAFDPSPVVGYGRYYLRVTGAGMPATWTSAVGRCVLTATGGKR